MNAQRSAQIQREQAYRALRHAVENKAPPEKVEELAHVAAEQSGVFWVSKLREAMEQGPSQPKRHRL